MEQIVKVDGILYYGGCRCRDADDAYRRFRDDYHSSLGRDASRRLNRYGSRKERIRGFGFVLVDDVRESLQRTFGECGKCKCYQLGLVGISYAFILGCWDYPVLSDTDLELWIDWALSSGSKALVRKGRKDKSGRTSKRLKKRYI